MAEKQIYFVQHGRCEETAQCEGLSLPLSEQGHEDAKKAGKELVELGLGGRALVLTSPVIREIETAQLISEELGSDIVQSSRLHIASRNIMAIKSLDRWIDKSLEEEGKKLEKDQPLVVVTNPILMAAVSVKGDATTKDLMEWYDAERWYGQVVEYQPKTWENSMYSNYQAFLALGPEYETAA